MPLAWMNPGLETNLSCASIDGINSTLFDLLFGTVQESILGPVLHANFVPPLFDIESCPTQMTHTS
jgi:hypothetical protein